MLCSQTTKTIATNICTRFFLNNDMEYLKNLEEELKFANNYFWHEYQMLNIYKNLL